MWLNKEARRDHRRMQVYYLRYSFSYDVALADIQGGYSLLMDCNPSPVARFVIELFRIAAFANLQVYRFFAFLARIS